MPWINHSLEPVPINSNNLHSMANSHTQMTPPSFHLTALKEVTNPTERMVLIIEQCYDCLSGEVFACSTKAERLRLQALERATEGTQGAWN